MDFWWAPWAWLLLTLVPMLGLILAGAFRPRPEQRGWRAIGHILGFGAIGLILLGYLATLPLYVFAWCVKHWEEPLVKIGVLIFGLYVTVEYFVPFLKWINKALKKMVYKILN